MLPAILIAAAGLANGEVCPAEIHTQQSGKDVPTGWQATVDFRRHALSGVRFFHGSPEKANDIYPRPIKANHYSYDFFATYRERWVACSYSFT